MYTQAIRLPYKKKFKRVRSKDLGDHSTSLIVISWLKSFLFNLPLLFRSSAAKYDV